MESTSGDKELRGLDRLAERLGLDVRAAQRRGVERNTAGIETDELLVSRRLDSRTYFVRDVGFGQDKRAGIFEGPDDELLARARLALEAVAVPTSEIAEQTVLAEQAQEGQVDPDTGRVQLGEVYPGKRLALLGRRVKDLPVWSSRVILGLTRERGIGFLQLHWPELPDEVLDRGRRLASVVEQGWAAPEREGAKVESVEAGILHSPAIGFVMESAAAIRVIYAPTDPAMGRKVTLYLDEEGRDVPLPRQFEKADEEPPGKRAVGDREGDIRKARGSFRALLLSNPNYFGNLVDVDIAPELVVVGDTFYEQIGCVAYEPELRRLEAVVHVRQESGYGGGICSAGSREFVRFYLSFDGGASWVDQGMSSVAVHDIPGKKPLEYDVTVHVDPAAPFCFAASLPRVRAILSWNNPPPPGDPAFLPVWGEVQEATIQIAPRKLIVFGDLLAEAQVKLKPELAALVDDATPLPVVKGTPLTAAHLHETYRATEVPPHRYLFTDIQKAIAGPEVAFLGAPGPDSSLVDLGIDLSAVIGALLASDGDKRYEELRCLGYNPLESALIGTLTVKRSSGYSGGLCTAGSKEYVAFWIDHGSGWTYAGTTSVDVHDIASLPPDGLQYAVFLPVDLSAYQRPCEQGAVTARVRAIMSWQTPPPPGNPDYVPTWGNREETIIQVTPGPGVDLQVPFLSAVGDIPESQVGPSGKATGSAIHTGLVAADSPFGGQISIAGHISNASSGLRYRVMRKPHGAPDTAYVPLTLEPSGLRLILNTWDIVNGWVQTTITRHADALGYYPFEDYSSNHSIEGDLMMRWYSTLAEDGQTFDLRIDLSVDGNPAHDLHSNVVAVLVDNTPPVAELDIDLGAGVQCADFDAGVTFSGRYRATDAHFGGFAFTIEPSGPPNDPPHGVLPTPRSGSSTFFGGTIGDPGVASGTYHLNTGLNAGPPPAGPMDACGYALILRVWDRTNVDSGRHRNWSRASVGFCLNAPGG